MPRPLALAPDATFRAIYSVETLGHRLRPFIQHVSDELARTSNLEASVLRAAELQPEAASYFVVEPGQIDQTFGLREEHLYAEREVASFTVETRQAVHEFDLSSAGSTAALQEVLAACTSGHFAADAARSSLSDDAQRLMAQLREIGILGERERDLAPFGSSNAYGIHRLQHASLLYRTPTSGVLVDPHLYSAYRPDGIASDIYKEQLAGKVDAILISHFHEDHFFLSTLLMFPLDTPIVVPRVPRSTIICADMERLLRQVGFRHVVAVDWYSEPLTFGDIRVHVLPFYGEQPLRYETARHSDIRNWGNTYVIETEAYRSWFLIDSGADALGSMEDVAYHVRDKIGRIDVVLSNLRLFTLYTPFYINGGLNWLTLSPRQLREFVSMRSHCITLGPAGVANVCKTVKARHYLPYAHWWGELGEDAASGIDTPGQEERAVLATLGDELRRVAAPTTILPWHIGDGFIAASNGQLRHVPIGAS